MSVMPAPFADRLAAEIDRRLADPDLSVQSLARGLGLSRRQLLRKVRSLTGKTPVELLRERRLAVAQQLISEGRVGRVQVVAAQVGMSPSHLSRAYRRRFGETPQSAISRHAQQHTLSFADAYQMTGVGR